MSQKKKERIHRIYGVVLAALIITVGVCFVLSCLSIYKSGSSPFTAENISTHFRRIAIPTYICMAGVLGGIILSLVLPVPESRIIPVRHPEDMLAEMVARARARKTSYDENDINAIRHERRRRRRMTVILGALTGLSMLPALIWCVNPAHFSVETLNADIKTAAFFVIPCAAMALGMWMVAVQLRYASVSREMELFRSVTMKLFKNKIGGRVIVGRPPAPSEANKTVSTGEESSSGMECPAVTPRLIWVIRGVILAVGVLFILLGIANGGMADVLGKAIRICTECIGLG